ncbi:EAL domain-containing protein [Acidiferrimicrobium sp. IK]|uniref:EAL domain-containing protein n=1 Tax=Acidiferrimicrobium sp. IK TaxID=2871700 RepID=UPI0021CB098F|nr:EAL domain-containing protein [Acidiferrimicrobium sp. IK]MCU4185866.1 EAL domain-containing protein [Acidiferrimicrobium sp. IK]
MREGPAQSRGGLTLRGGSRPEDLLGADGAIDLIGAAAQAFDSAPAGAVVATTSGRLVLVNQAFGRLLGYEPAELVGRSFADFTDERDRDASEVAMAALLAGEAGGLQLDKRYVRSSGSSVWVRVQAAVVHDVAGTPAALIVHCDDIDDRRRAEQHLRLSEAFLDRIFNLSAVPTALLDGGGRAHKANVAMLSLLGRGSFSGVSGVHLLEHVLPPDRNAIRGLCSSSGTDVKFEARIQRADGAVLAVLCLIGAATAADGGRVTVLQMIDVSERKAAENIATFRALHDELTGVANRRLLVQDMRAAIGDRRFSRHKTAVLMIDLDRFKEVNDGLGHAAGDAVLVEVARRLEAVTRRADTVGRVGGDEFWVVASDIRDEMGAITLATAILDALSLPFSIQATKVHVGASIGFALAPDDGTTARDLMTKADAAQYRAKSLRSGWAAYAQAADDHRLDQLGLTADLKAAIEAQALTIVYQPLVSAAGHIRGFEALSRWHHPERGLIPPDVFIPLAEHAKLTLALTRTVLRRSARQCALWRAAGHDVSIAVNLPPLLLHDPSLPELISTELAAAGLEHRHLTLEITEGRLADGFDPLVSKSLQDLHDLGVRLSIDDFGTGYSSLAYLKELPVDELKIDKSFIVHLDTDRRDVAIVRSLMDLARILRMDVVAEGVESHAIAAILREAGCDVLQGFGLGRPQSAEAATILLASEQAVEDRQPAEGPAHLLSDRNLRILLADNNAKARTDLSRTLASLGHQVLVAATGAEALEAVHRDDAIDLVIASQVLGTGLSGVQASIALRAEGCECPIIILFALSHARAMRSRRFPIDVWPVARDDRPTLLYLVRGCSASGRLQPARAAARTTSQRRSTRS